MEQRETSFPENAGSKWAICLAEVRHEEADTVGVDDHERRAAAERSGANLEGRQEDAIASRNATLRWRATKLRGRGENGKNHRPIPRWKEATRRRERKNSPRSNGQLKAEEHQPLLENQTSDVALARSTSTPKRGLCKNHPGRGKQSHEHRKSQARDRKT